MGFGIKSTKRTPPSLLSASEDFSIVRKPPLPPSASQQQQEVVKDFDSENPKKVLSSPSHSTHPTNGNNHNNHSLFASNSTTATFISTGGSSITSTTNDMRLANEYQMVESDCLSAAAALRKSRNLVYMCGFCASLTSILLGYDVGIMSIARKYVDGQLNLCSVQSEVIMGSLNLIAAFGGLIAGKTADHFGRNRAIAIACLIFLTGSACMTLAWNFRILLIGRIVTGLGVGCGFVIAPVYIAEITPPEIRGRMVSLTDVCINVGIVFGSIVGFVCEQTIISDDFKWRVMLGIGIVPPIIILATLKYLPESPRWLLLKHRVQEARTVLKLITGSGQQADREVMDIQEAIQVEQGVTSDWSEVLWPRHRAILLPVLMGLALGFFQQSSGSEAAVYYSPQILGEVGVTSTTHQSLGNIAISTFKFAGELLAMFSMDKLGRKPLFVISAIGSGLFLILAGTVFSVGLSPLYLVTSLCLFMGFFSVGMGAITFVVASELFPLPVRGKAMALTVFVNRLLSGIVALSFLSLVEAVSYANTFYLFALFSFISVIFYGFLMPETKGKTLEQISNMFESESAAYAEAAHHRSSSSFSPSGGGGSINNSTSPFVGGGNKEGTDPSHVRKPSPRVDEES